MTISQAEAAIQVGIDVVNAKVDNGMQMAATGEMGIGNTTPSATITALLCGRKPAEVTGRCSTFESAGISDR